MPVFPRVKKGAPGQLRVPVMPLMPFVWEDAGLPAVSPSVSRRSHRGPGPRRKALRVYAPSRWAGGCGPHGKETVGEGILRFHPTRFCRSELLAFSGPGMASAQFLNR